MNSKLSQLLIVICFGFLFFASCKYSYYKAVARPAEQTENKTTSINEMLGNSRYFILRNGNNAYHMKDIRVSDDKKSITSILEKIPVEHDVYIRNTDQKKLKYSTDVEDKERDVLNEAHLFITQDTSINYGTYTLSLDKVNKIEMIQFDREKTANRHTVTGIVVVVGAIVLVALIAIALKSSCPFVSSYYGNEFSLQGEIYGGAIYPQLERHDYLPLQMQPLPDGTLQLKISNELKERQFTDIADLWVITHEKGSHIVADEQGNLFSITSPLPPVRAVLNDHKDVTKSLLFSGDNDQLLMDDTTSTNGSNEVYIKFNNPGHDKNARLVLTLKNSYFLDLLYGEVAKGFGIYYNTYVVEQRKKPLSELTKWTREQQIPLVASVKTSKGWQQVSEITTIGPVATREMAIQLQLPDNSEPFTEVRLSSGFMFWEIDKAGIEYSVDNNFVVQKCKPVAATDHKGNNVLSTLTSEDGYYLSQPNIGDNALLVYQPSLYDSTKATSYILHAKGYYEHVRAFTNKPDVAFLQQFKKPNAFPMFGLSLYKKAMNTELKTVARSN